MCILPTKTPPDYAWFSYPVALCCIGWLEHEREMKAKMLEAAETRGDVTGVQYHFPFDDFDENP
jgi:hypothetical protein